MKKLLSLIFLVFILLPGPVSAQSPEEGAALYQQKCTGCHTIGGGNLSGPDLQGVTQQREHDWLVRWLMEPDAMLAEGDPTATQLLAEFNNVPMPNLGITQTEAEAILAFLENPEAAGGAGAAPAVKALPPGNPNRGQALFLGQQALANGGTACIACHSSGSHGALGGGTLGPDLTHAAYRYGTPGFQVSLQGLPFPTMQGVFDNRPLTDQEVADLHAFLVQEDLNAAPQQQSGLSFVLAGLAGSVGLLVVGHVTWRKRQNGGIRQTLVDRANRP